LFLDCGGGLLTLNPPPPPPPSIRVTQIVGGLSFMPFDFFHFPPFCVHLDLVYYNSLGGMKCQEFF
jgi:hypothetical protein